MRIFIKKTAIVFVACFVFFALFVFTGKKAEAACALYPAVSTTYTWDGGGDGMTWSDPLNWTANSGYPGDTANNRDSVIINGAYTVRATTTLTTKCYTGADSKGEVSTVALDGGATLILGELVYLQVETAINVQGNSTLKLGDSSWGSGFLTVGNGQSDPAYPFTIAPGSTFDPATGTVKYFASPASNNLVIATTTYYFLSASTTSDTGSTIFYIGQNNGMSGTVTTTQMLIGWPITTGYRGILNGNGGTINITGSGQGANMPFKFKCAASHGCINAWVPNGSRLILSGSAATDFGELANVEYGRLEISGAGIKYLAANNTAATSSWTIASGSTLNLGGFVARASSTVAWTNNGTVVTGGGFIFHPSSPEFTDSGGATVASYSSPSTIYAKLTDTSYNYDATVAETVDIWITATSTISDSETLTLNETGVATGIFTGSIAFVSSASDV